MRVLAALSILACVQLVAENIVSIIFKTNYFLVDFYTIVEFLLLAAVFLFSTKSKASRLQLAILSMVFFVYWVVDMIQKSSSHGINIQLAMVSRVFIIAVAFVGFHAALKEESSDISRIPTFWVSFAVFLYSAGTLVVFGLSNQLLRLGRTYFDIAWHINWTLLIVANLMYSKGMLCRETT